MGLIVDDIRQDLPAANTAGEELIDWRQRYEGVLMVAYLDGKAVAGISGPWPVNQYALTWWDRPVPARQLELFGSLAEAQQRVEEWANRMRTIGVADRPANDPVLPEATVSIAPSRTSAPASASWVERLREAINGASPPAERLPRERLDTLRRPPLNEDDLRGVHFAAIE
ncbi:MAG TPA: hypothetical protein VJ696_14215 [Rhodanobacteraceae bacterium]|nr:hypothetical protein [Rhodanobacteraceae bacterium]